MNSYFESKEFREKSLIAIKKDFEAGLPVYIDLKDFPNKEVRIYSSGKVEEIHTSYNGEISVLNILSESHQEINHLLEKADLL